MIFLEDSPKPPISPITACLQCLQQEGRGVTYPHECGKNVAAVNGKDDDKLSFVGSSLFFLFFFGYLLFLQASSRPQDRISNSKNTPKKENRIIGAPSVHNVYIYIAYIIYIYILLYIHTFIQKHIPPQVTPQFASSYPKACPNLQAVWWLYKAYQTVEQGTHVFTAWKYTRSRDPWGAVVCLCVYLFICLFGCLVVWLVGCLVGWLFVCFLISPLFLWEFQNTILHKHFEIPSWSILVHTCYVPIVLVMKVLLLSSFPSLTNS